MDTDGQKKTIHPKRLAALRLAFLLLISLTIGFAGGWLGAQANREYRGDTSDARQIVSTESELISQIASDVGPSVVSISVLAESTVQGFFGPEQSQEERAGTGFIISEDGLVVTNRHLLPSNEAQVTIVLSDGTELSEVEVVGRTNDGDPLDIAFLKINDARDKELKPVILGDSADMEVGDRAVAIGNALGQFQNSVTTGIISGYGRDIEASDGTGFNTETLQNLFQTHAAINQGNSGGPLVNMNGEVIGVNTAVAGEGENIGFAIPINDIKGLIQSVLQTGELRRPYLGVRYVMLTDDLAYTYDLETKRGAYILSSSTGQPAIVPDSPAEKAGLQERDIITKVNNTEVNEDNSLISLISQYQVGKKITLTIVRGDEERAVDVTLEETP